MPYYKADMQIQPTFNGNFFILQQLTNIQKTVNYLRRQKKTNKQTEKKTTKTKDKHNAELQQKPPREDAHGVTMTLKHAKYSATHTFL